MLGRSLPTWASVKQRFVKRATMRGDGAPAVSSAADASLSGRPVAGYCFSAWQAVRHTHSSMSHRSPLSQTAKEVMRLPAPFTRTHDTSGVTVGIRSLLFIRTNIDAIRKVLAYQPDAIVFDMEDAIPLAGKAEHRKRTAEVLRQLPAVIEAATQSVAPGTTSEPGSLQSNNTPGFRSQYHGPLVCLRVNSLDEMALLEEDLRVLIAELPHNVINALLLPKLRSASDVHTFEKLVAAAERASGMPDGYGVRFIPIVETAEGVANAFSIAKNARNIAMIMGHADLLQDLDASDSPDVLQYPRSVVVTAARAAGLEPIDSAFLHLKDIVAYQKECTRGKLFGFSGKVVLHPALVPLTNLSYLPLKQDVIWAQKVLAARHQVRVEDGTGTPKGIFMVDGAVAGPPAIAKATKIMAQAGLAGTTRLYHPAIPSNRPMIVSTGGIDLHRIHAGQEITSALELTMTDAQKQAWIASFFEASPYITSELTAEKLGLPRSPMPPTMMIMLVVAMSVMKFSESAIVHLSLKNFHMSSLVFPGDTLRNKMQVLAYRNTQDKKSSVIVSRHVLTNQREEDVCSVIKTTMFPPIPHLGDQRVALEGSADIMTMQKIAPYDLCSWLPRLKPEGLLRLIPVLALPPTTCIVHRLVKIFGGDEHRGLVNLVRVTNPHHINTLQFSPSQLLIAGPFSIAAVLSCAYLDLGPIIAEVIHNVTNFNKVNAGDVLGAVTYIIGSRVLPQNPYMEELQLVTFGIKNIDMQEVVQHPLPESLVAHTDTDMHPTRVEEICRREAPLLYHKIVMKIDYTVVRPARPPPQ
jgi:citrate lyase beta subunit/acyl dehydratase